MSTSEDSAGPPQVVITIVALARRARGSEGGQRRLAFRPRHRPQLDDDSPLPEILVFAAVSAATVAVAKNWATHRAEADRRQPHVRLGLSRNVDQGLADQGRPTCRDRPCRKAVASGAVFADRLSA